MTAATQTDPTPPLPGPVRRQRAVTSIEYALIAGAIALVVAFAAPAVGTNATTVFCKVAAAFGGASGCVDTAVAGGNGSTPTGTTGSGSTTTGSGSTGSSSGSGTTAPTPCPASAGWTGTYEPSCYYSSQPSCPSGDTGAYDWNSGSQAWVSNCVAPPPPAQNAPPPATSALNCGGYSFPPSQFGFGAFGMWSCYETSGAKYAGVVALADQPTASGQLPLGIMATYPDGSHFSLEQAASGPSGLTWPSLSSASCTATTPAPLSTTLATLDATQRSVFTTVPDLATDFQPGAETRMVFCPAS